MNKKTVNILRDLALKYETTDVQVAYELMSIVYNERPDGIQIKHKFLKYQNQLRTTDTTKTKLTQRGITNTIKSKLSQLVARKDIAIIPIGFRCKTARLITETLGVTQASLPFDSGFFSPKSIASVLSNPRINLKYNDQGLTHKVCIKKEGHNDAVHGRGIKFETSDYESINSKATHPEMDCINNYLDRTGGYYTLDVRHQFVLAHYNWHPFARPSKSKGIVDPEKNLNTINEMLNRRIERMFELCREARMIYFIYGEFQKLNYIQIDDNFHALNDFSQLENVIKNAFDKPYSILNIGSNDDISKILLFAENA